MKGFERQALLEDALCLVDEDILARAWDHRASVAVAKSRRRVHLFGRSMSVAAATWSIIGTVAAACAVVAVAVPILLATVNWIGHLPIFSRPPVTDTTEADTTEEPTDSDTTSPETADQTDTETPSEITTETDSDHETDSERETVTPDAPTIVDELYDTIPFRDAVIHSNGTGKTDTGDSGEWLMTEYATHLYRSVEEMEAAGLDKYLDSAVYTEAFFRENTLLLVQQMRSSNGYELLELTDLAVIDGRLYPVLTWKIRGDYAGMIMTYGTVTAHIRNSDLPEGITVPEDWALNRILDQAGEARYDDFLDYRDLPLAPSEVEDQVSFLPEVCETVPFQNPQVIRKSDAYAMGEEHAVVIESYGELLRYDPKTTYTQDFFEENVLLLVCYKGQYDYIGECVQSLVGLAVIDGKVHPVLSLYLNIQTAPTEMNTFVTAEIRRADLPLPLGDPYIIVTAMGAYNPDHYEGGFDAFPLKP